LLLFMIKAVNSGEFIYQEEYQNSVPLRGSF
jgi:hypothetical protein